MERRTFILEMNPYRKMYGDFRIPQDGQRNPLIIFCHGFKGFKDWGGWHYALDKFCHAGYFVAAFNFTYNGIGHDLQNFTELDKFAENTIGKELEDVHFLLEQLEKNQNFSEIAWKPKIGIIGHSRGGATVLLKAADDDRIDTVVTWAGMASWERYLEQRSLWYDQGFIEIENARTGQLMRMNRTFLEDIENNLEKRNILKAKSRLKVPHLIIHGNEDPAVPLSDAESLFASSNKENTVLDIIIGGNHTFGQSHPFNGSTPHFDEVINKSISWFDKHLR